jgi:hypothetical protein
MPLYWNGNDITKKMKEAEKKGLFQNGTRICMEARVRVRVDTTALQSSIKPQTEQAEVTGDGFKLDIGSDNGLVEYAAIQELGPSDGRSYSYTPYMRPSVDSNFSNKITDDIKEFLD